MLSIFARLRRITEPTFSSLFFLPPEISSFSGTSIAITPHCDSKGMSDLRGNKVFGFISSDLLLLNDPDTPTLLYRNSPDISFATSSLSLASKKCFRAWALIPYQFYYPSVYPLLRHKVRLPLPSIFRKLIGVTLSFTFTLTIFMQRNTSLFPLLLLSLAADRRKAVDSIFKRFHQRCC